ncbi:MAG: hypothetical protein K6G07_05370 [Lachnospiraceae bacterium]|nr:hypothetical protein [Lachnospiraceae bacterium]
MSAVNGVSNVYTDAYSNYSAPAVKTEVTEPAEDKTAKAAVTFEASAAGKEKAAAMTKEDRTAIVSQLKADAQARIDQMTSLVQKMFGDQGQAIGLSDDMWKKLANGEFEVDEATRAEARASIAEDGYWGVAQTSQRMFDFAMALTGGDADKMEEMRGAFEKGFKMATGTWGKELPEISQKTYDATQKLFDDYAASIKAAQEANVAATTMAE